MMGIYQIKNIKTGKVYIGSSKNIEDRWKEHLYNLKNNKHHSIKLQKSYNKCKDKSVFVFEVIEEVKNESSLKEREQYYIDLFDAYNSGYNCCEKVDNPKYARKKQNKSNKKALEEFKTLHNQYFSQLIISKSFLKRLLDGGYSCGVYKRLVEIIKWFLEKYGANYYAQIDVNGNRQYWLTINDYNNNPFVCYHYKNGKMFLSKYDTETYRSLIELSDIHYIVE